MSRQTKQIIVAALLLMIICMLPGCAKKSSQTQMIMDSGTLRVLMNPEYPPYGYRDAEGNIVGADVELAKRIAAIFGVELEIVEKDFAELEQALLDGEGDVIISAYPMTQDLLCSSPYVDTALYVLTAADNEMILTEADLEGKIIGVQQYTQGDIYVTDMVSAKNVDRYAYASEAVQALLEGKLEAVITDGITAEQLQTQYAEQLKRVYIGSNVMQYCVAMRPESDLYTDIEGMLATLQASGDINAYVLQNTVLPMAAQPPVQTEDEE